MIVCDDQEFGVIFADDDTGAAALCVLLECTEHGPHLRHALVRDRDDAGETVVCDRRHIGGSAVVVERVRCIQRVGCR